MIDYKKINQQAEQIIKNNIYSEQSNLIQDLLRDDYFDYNDILNFDTREHDDFDKLENEILSWYAISPWLCDKLKEKGEVLLENKYGIWWGRATFGQPIMQDSVIQEIANECN